jgi:peptide-methionine (S)-S-oxide reductase
VAVTASPAGRDGLRLRPIRALRLLAGLILAGLLGTSLTAAADPDETAPGGKQGGKTARAIFAGGCFWCMEPPYDALPGVLSTTSGYIGGHVDDPSYAAVTTGRTGHTEAVEVVYDPAQVSYDRLLHVFWRNIDPLAVDRQFCDVGSQYRSGIFWVDEGQRRLAEASKAGLEADGRFDQPIATEITAASTFYPAEDYHQDYYLKNPIRYKYYRNGCRRDQRLRELWGEEAGG